MVKLLSPQKLANQPIIGKQLFDVITSGMYDNPLMIYREYIQNAVDSIDFAYESGIMSIEAGKIKIYVDGEKREIAIEDNGTGISNDSADHILRSIGASPKEGQKFRGFRGIGRLGGLAYCDELLFETRSSASELVCQVSWNRQAFDRLSADSTVKFSLQETISRVSRVSFIQPDDETPSHFFRVRLRGVRRFHADFLMSVKAITSYLSQVAPVPYNQETFKFAGKIQSYLSVLSDYRCYNIELNGRRIYRPYVDEFQLSEHRRDSIHNIELFSFKSPDTSRLALGWFAETDFLASLPQKITMRGIRIRQGNIEVGDEHFLNEMYTEPRFAGWTIGEIHICESRLKPNARRDGFEISPNYEAFLEQAQALGRGLSKLCRKASNHRIQKEIICREIAAITGLLAGQKMFIDDAHIHQARSVLHDKIGNLERLIEKVSPSNGYRETLASIRKAHHDKISSCQTIETGGRVCLDRQKRIISGTLPVHAATCFCGSVFQ